MNQTAEPADFVDPISSRLGYQLRRASSAMMVTLGRDMADIGLRPVEATIIVLVGANPGCIQSELGRRLGIKRANMAPLVAALLARGLIDKSPVDGRSLALYLTGEGEGFARRIDTIMDMHEARFANLLDDGDQSALRSALAAIAAVDASADD